MKKKIFLIILFSVLAIFLISCKKEHFDQSNTNLVHIINGKLYLDRFCNNDKTFDSISIEYGANITYNAIDGEKTLKLYGIYENAFYVFGENTEKIVFDNSDESELTIFMKRAFMCCINLREIIIPDSVKFIEQNAFNTCGSLLEVEMKGLVILGDTAFAGCSSLKSIVIGERIESIGSYAFLYCHNDLELTILASTPPVIGMEILKGVENFTIKVPKDAVAAYKNDSAWGVYGERIIGIES